MPEKFPLNAEQSSNVTLEVLFRLKVLDAMTKETFCGSKDQTLRDLQSIMKTNGISGVPILDKKKLIGMISLDDIITAFDKGYIDDKVSDHMTRNLIVLEDDMPLTFAISYLNKYSFRRFPVINKFGQYVGIISSRDVLSSLIDEMSKEIKRLEEKIGKKEPAPVNRHDKVFKEFSIRKYDFENAGHPSFELKKILQENDISRKVIRRASIAAYEMEINVAIHSEGGNIVFKLDNNRIEIVTNDYGPGIADLNAVQEQGFSTANDWIRSLGFGAGMGIPNIKRVSDEFDIKSEVGKGTTVKSIIFLGDEDESK